ncbi:c-type cytochrome [Maribacter algicola]|uniref:C-type cytochrome n=1 Tax=Meishania litoralis TaxID=3434685 RepID=A0ACC7LFM2_9FLAO
MNHRIVPKPRLSVFILFGLVVLTLGCADEIEPSPPLTPEEALASFVLADDNLQIELVASEPLVQDPVAMTFDEAGRLWVVEMLGFMTDIDGTDEQARTGRVSVLFDDDGDGKMDRGSIFLDSLVLPRAIALVKGGILVSENIPLWYAQDTDGDFKADSKVLIDSTYGGSGMPEHSANGLWRGLDNWLYNAKSKYRYKRVGDKWIKDETEFRGQWGIVHDDAGRLFYNYNWSQLHGDLVPPNALLRNKNHTPSSGIDHGLTLEREIFPIRSNTAVNRGYVPGTLDAQGRLLEFASACGPLVYRGNGLPDNYNGNAFVCEPTANLIKRNTIIEEGFMLSAKGIYDDREFLASTDERFRPISMASGPDGALYVVDMYKGIIQHGPYMSDYLRQVTLERKLDKPIHMGRIWRITKKGNTDNKIPDLSEADSKELVALLGNRNGWIRDTAQRILVQKGDLIADDLEEVLENGNPLAQLHALWTLEGLGLITPEVLLPVLDTGDPRVTATALRLMENMESNHVDVKRELEKFSVDRYEKAHPYLQMQMVLASHRVDSKTALETSKKFLARFGHLPVARDVVMSSLQDRELEMLTSILQNGAWEKYDQKNEIFVEMLATAIANSEKKSDFTVLLKIAEGNEHEEPEWLAPAVVNGILNARGHNDSGKILLDSEAAVLRRKGVSEALYKKLAWPGKPKEEVVEATGFEVDSDIYATGRQKYLNLCANCHGTQGEGMKRFAPPLKGSEWVLGEQYKLAMILLHGMEGPVTVKGKLYDIPDILPSMPSFSTLQNEDIAAIATYIRNSWGNSASPLESRTVGGIRFRTQGQITPWKASELDTLRFNIDL